jgi:hypothetical protein
MSPLNTKAPNVVRPATSFHRNHAGRKRIKKIQLPMPLEPFAKHNRSRFIQPAQATNGLAQINAQNLDVHQILLSPPMSATLAAGWWEGCSSH